MSHRNENLRLTENMYQLYLLLSLLLLLALTACAATTDTTVSAVHLGNPPTPGSTITLTPTPPSCLIRAHIVTENAAAAWSSPTALVREQAITDLDAILTLLAQLNEKSMHASNANSIILQTDACTPEDLSNLQDSITAGGSFDNLALTQVTDAQGNIAALQITLRMPDGSTLTARLPLNQMWSAEVEIDQGFTPSLRPAEPAEMAGIWNRINATQIEPIASIVTTSDNFSTSLVNSGQLLAPIIMETLAHAATNQVLVIEVTANYGTETQKYLSGARITADATGWLVQNSATSVDILRNQVVNTDQLNYVDTTIPGVPVTIAVYLLDDIH